MGLDIAILFGLALTIAVLLQWVNRVYDAELGSIYPDEASHFINSLLISSYLIDGWGTSPIAFAKTFSMHYPKISIGHWPPLYYVLAGAWLILWQNTKAAALALSAGITAALATLTGTTIARCHGRLAGAAAAIILVLLPIMQLNTNSVMVDVFLALIELAATLTYVRYLMQPGWRPAVAFAVFAAAAILIKGNGLAIGLLPPMAVLLTGRLVVVRHFSFWLPALITLLLCMPWYIMTYPLLHDGFNYSFGLGYTLLAVGENGRYLVRSVGIFAASSAVVGFAGAFRPSIVRSSSWNACLRCGLAAHVLSVFVFQAVMPMDIQARYMIPAISPLLLLAAAGIADIAGLAKRWCLWSQAGVTCAIVAIVILAVTPKLPDMLTSTRKPLMGMIQAAQTVIGSDGGESPVVLIASDARGEGAFVVEVALQDRGQRLFVARGYKLLSSANFMTDNYVPRFDNPTTLSAELERLGVRFVVIDTAEPSLRIPHVQLLIEAAAQRRWKALGRFPHDGMDGETLVYQLDGKRAPGVAATAAVGCAWFPATAVAAEGHGLLRPLQFEKPYDTCQ